MIFVLTGLSGSGKTTLAKNVELKNNKIFKIVLFTDRPQRPGEINGYDYHFVTKKEYDKLLKTKTLITNEIIPVYKDVWRYGAYKYSSGVNKILAGSPEQTRQLKEFFGDENVISILIRTDENLRLDRIYNRKDNQHKEEIKRRTIEDIKKYENFKPDYIVENNGTIDNATNKILKIINSKIRV